MKKAKTARLVLILSLLVFIGLLAFYIVSSNANKPKTVSKREQYQQELQIKGDE